jgi:hypothetical protein
MRNAAIATALVLALALGGGAALLASSGGDDAPAPGAGPQASATSQSGRSSAPGTAPSAAPPSTPGAPSTEAPPPAAPAPSTTAPTTPAPTAPRDGRDVVVPPLRRFSGTGNTVLGTVDVRVPAAVSWRSEGRLALRFSRAQFPVTAPSAAGQFVVPPYRFERVRVVAKGRWTITVKPLN